MSRTSEMGAGKRALQDVLCVSSLGWDLAVPIFGAALLGHSLDQRFQTGALTTLLLLVLGVLVGAYNARRTIRRGIGRNRPSVEDQREEHLTP